jgi:hypothetical protein
MTDMTTPDQPGIRASDGERDKVASAIQAATAEGRLTMEEADERLEQLFATKYRHELAQLTADLPAEEPTRQADAAAPTGSGSRMIGRVPLGLAIHGAIVAVWSVLLIVRWTASDVPFFWPIFPMFWMGVSLLIHAAIRGRRSRRTWGPPRPAVSS